MVSARLTVGRGVDEAEPVAIVVTAQSTVVNRMAALARLVGVHTASARDQRLGKRDVAVMAVETRQSECGAADDEDECERFDETQNLMARHGERD